MKQSTKSSVGSVSTTTTTSKPWFTFNGDSFTVDGKTTPIAPETLAKLSKIAKIDGVSTEETFFKFIQQGVEAYLAKSRARIGQLTCDLHMNFDRASVPNALLVDKNGDLFLGWSEGCWHDPIPCAECNIERPVTALEAAEWFIPNEQFCEDFSGSTIPILKALADVVKAQSKV